MELHGSFLESDKEDTVSLFSIVLIVHFSEHSRYGGLENGASKRVVASTSDNLEDMVAVIANVRIDVARVEAIYGYLEASLCRSDRFDFRQTMQVNHP